MGLLVLVWNARLAPVPRMTRARKINSRAFKIRHLRAASLSGRGQRNNKESIQEFPSAGGRF